jgi:cytochrome P450
VLCWRSKSSFTFLLTEVFHKETTKLALNVVSGAAYGRPSAWNELEEVPVGHVLSYVDSIRSVVDHLILYFVFPRAFLHIPLPLFKEAKLAYDEFGGYLHGLLKDYKTGESVIGGNSVLQALVENSESVSAKVGPSILTDEELVGNAFVIFLGGHESMYVSLLDPLK